MENGVLIEESEKISYLIKIKVIKEKLKFKKIEFKKNDIF